MNNEYFTPENETQDGASGEQVNSWMADAGAPEYPGQEDMPENPACNDDNGTEEAAVQPPGGEPEDADGETYHPPEESGTDAATDGNPETEESGGIPSEDTPAGESDASGEGSGPETASPDTEPRPRGRTARTRTSARRTSTRKKGDQEDEGQAPGQDGEGKPEDVGQEDEGETAVQPESGEALSEAQVPEQGAAPEAGSRGSVRRRPRPAGRGGNVVLDASGEAMQGSGDAMDEDYYTLQTARNARSVMSGPITAYETSPGGSPIVVSAVGNYKVIIPINEMGIAKRPNEPDDETAMNYRYRRLIDSMLGATIDFVIKGVDYASQLAAASRAEALAYKRRHILNGTDRDGNFRVYGGLQCMARVLAVGDRFARVEIFGHEVTLSRQDVTRRWVEDIREILRPGDERKVVITRLDRDEKGETTVLRASIAEAETQVDMTQLLNIKVGNVYMGRITNIHRNCYFVRSGDLNIDVLCPAAMSYTPTMPKINDTVKFVVRSVSDGKVTGSITRIQRKGGGARG